MENLDASTPVYIFALGSFIVGLYTMAKGILSYTRNGLIENHKKTEGVMADKAATDREVFKELGKLQGRQELLEKIIFEKEN